MYRYFFGGEIGLISGGCAEAGVPVGLSYNDSSFAVGLSWRSEQRKAIVREFVGIQLEIEFPRVRYRHG